jgi:hypothetical protein
MTRPIALVAILALAACERPLAPSPEATKPGVPAALNDVGDVTKDNLKLDVSGVVTSPCTGEDIAFDGSTHIVTTTTETADGAIIKTHFNTQGVSGIGLSSGAKYQIVQVQNGDATDVFVPAGASGDMAIHERYISQGSLDNFLADIVFTFTFPPFNATYKVRNLRCEG